MTTNFIYRLKTQTATITSRRNSLKMLYCKFNLPAYLILLTDVYELVWLSVQHNWEFALIRLYQLTAILKMKMQKLSQNAQPTISHRVLSKDLLYILPAACICLTQRNALSSILTIKMRCWLTLIQHITRPSRTHIWLWLGYIHQLGNAIFCKDWSPYVFGFSIQKGVYKL
jgi:hypothetical protein